MDTFNHKLITKQIPNAISVIRILLSFVLLDLQPLSASFFVIYSLCILSDAADGFIARKMSTTSGLGAVLDSIADVVFIAAIGIIFIPLFTFPIWTLVWMSCIALIRVGSLGIGYLRYHSLTFLHTYANKVTGLILYSFPVLITLFDFLPSVILICIVATVSAIEDMLINATSHALDLNVSSIIGIKKRTLQN